MSEYEDLADRIRAHRECSACDEVSGRPKDDEHYRQGDTEEQDYPITDQLFPSRRFCVHGRCRGHKNRTGLSSTVSSLWVARTDAGEEERQLLLIGLV